jgi:isoleucyl-tRNA synthetase
VDGEAVELAPEEILVQTQPSAGLAVAADKGVTVAVDATITPELRAEGLAREVVRRIQTMRKDAGFSIDDRITTSYVAEGELAEVMAAWGDYIRAETLTTQLVAGPAPAGAYSESHTIEGIALTLGVKKNA